MSESQTSNSNLEKGRGLLPSRDTLYKQIAIKAPELIELLLDMATGKEPANPVRMGVAKILLNKVLPDLRVTELQGNPERPLGVVILPELKLNEQQHNMDTTPRATDGSPISHGA